MAIVAIASNHMKYMMATKKIDLSTDVLKVALMKNTLAFNKDTHGTWASVSSEQIASTGGYVMQTITGQSVTEDLTNDKAAFVCADPSWTASGGTIGPFRSMVIYDDTTTDDTVICCIDFGVDYTVVAGASFTAQTIKLSLN